MIKQKEAWSNRQKDKGWGCAFAHWIPLFWIYYAITRRTITPFLYQIAGVFIVSISIALVSKIFDPNVDDATLENLGSVGGIVASPLFVKKGIDQSRKFGKKRLDIN